MSCWLYSILPGTTPTLTVLPTPTPPVTLLPTLPTPPTLPPMPTMATRYIFKSTSKEERKANYFVSFIYRLSILTLVTVTSTPIKV